MRGDSLKSERGGVKKRREPEGNRRGGNNEREGRIRDGATKRGREGRLTLPLLICPALQAEILAAAFPWKGKEERER